MAEENELHASYEQMRAHIDSNAGRTAVSPPARLTQVVLTVLLAAVVALTLWFAWAVP